MFIVNDADRTQIAGSVVLKVFHDSLGNGTTSNNHHILCRREVPHDFCLLHQKYAIAQANRTYKAKLDKGPKNIVGQRHSLQEYPCADRVDNACEKRGQQNAVEIMHSGIFPHAIIQAKKSKDDDTDDRIDGRKLSPDIELLLEQL